MPKTEKKKPAKAKGGPSGGASVTSVTGALQAGQTKPSDAGRASANVGGKGASSKKGR